VANLDKEERNSASRGRGKARRRGRERGIFAEQTMSVKYRHFYISQWETEDQIRSQNITSHHITIQTAYR
jgi:hypothetical protein